ncbi:COG3178 Predicted phosphotransferase related to Ser/Thr protein kinases [Rhabdaerophilaceae bacterium]
MSRSPSTWQVELPDERATVAFARRLAAEMAAGDLVTLTGDLGAGKTNFARAMIRAMLNDGDVEVPSPTYTLIQTYEGPRFDIVHADLYRIADPAELAELGWEEAAQNALVLVEWADRAGDVLAVDRLDVSLATTGPTGAGRRMVLTGYGSFAVRLERARAIFSLLDRTGFGEARRDYMLGDASVRAYERLSDEASGQTAILMIAPRRPDGPPIRLGKPYSTLVHLAESVHAFVAVGNGLLAEGLSAPRVRGHDLDAGLLLIEDLGTLGVVDENGPVPERYKAAIEVLATLHARDLPTELPVAEGLRYKLHRYDLEALTIEAELLLDWYFPYAAKRSPNASARLSFIDHWISTLEPVVSGPKTWTLRDYHSPNLIWLPDREGLSKVGIIDYQDCVLGHPAYDVASLAQDARVTVSEALEFQLLAAYARARRVSDPAFDLSEFTAAYAIMGAQRATKILGIFIRLDRRDGKPAYLKHLPRIEAYLKRCLAHPALAKLRGWYESNLPGLIGPPEVKNAHELQNADHNRNAAGGGPWHKDAPADGQDT